MITANNKSLTFCIGYLLSVESWQNDGDNYQTRHKAFSTREEAELAIDIVVRFAKLMEDQDTLDAFDSSHFTKEQIDYVIQSTNDYAIPNTKFETDLATRFSNFTKEYLGSSEYSPCRTYDCHVIRKIPQNITFDVVSHGTRYLQQLC